MLVELRAYGVGIVICDQHPSRVAREVIKSAAAKVAFRQVDKDDREQLGNTMLLSELELEELARLSPGQAFFFREGYYGPRRIRAASLYDEMDMSQPPMGEEILPFIKDDPWFKEAQRRRLTGELAQLHEGMDDLEDNMLPALKAFALLNEQAKRLLAGGDSGQQQQDLMQVIADAQECKRQVTDAVNGFQERTYQCLLSGMPEVIEDERVQAYRDQLRQRWEQTILPGARAFSQKIGELIARCQKDGGRKGDQNGQAQ